MTITSSNVVALSTASPRWWDVRGRQVFTSIVREPTPGPIIFGESGPEGNATAVHTEQVLAFSAEHYDYWTSALGLPREIWGWCHWGENLTVSGLDEHTLRIGDVLNIGSSARFEVTSPRIPCSKLAWRIGQPDSVLSSIIESGRIGFYLSVLNPGVICAGDPVSVFYSDPDAITVADLSKLLVATNVDIAVLKQVGRMPALGAQARGMIRKRLTSLEDTERLAVGRWQGWRTFDVTELKEEVTGVRSFRLAAADGQAVAPFRAGQFLTVQVGDDPAALVSRTWSLSDYDDRPKNYRLTIRREPGGFGSGWMHDAAARGSVVLARPPAGRFTLDRGGFMRVVLISAGIGVTPMIAMLKAHIARSDEVPTLLWLHSTRSGATHIGSAEVDEILRANDFKRQVFYSDPGAEDLPGAQYDQAGRLTPERLVAIFAAPYSLNPFGRQLEFEGVHSDVYTCGPPAFETMVRETLLGLGVSATCIRSETFAVPISGGGRSSPVKAHVELTGACLSADWFAEDDLTLLELAEALGIHPSFACRMGSCGTCEVGLLSGEVDYDPAPVTPPAQGRVLLCCSRPASPVVRIDL